MPLKKELIQFNIINQTDCAFNLPLFQQNVYSVNATTKYTWDITTADLSCGTGTIVVNGNTLPLVFAANLAGLLAALNALGFGFFCSQTFEGSTYFYTVDDTNVYGDVDLCPVVGTTTTTTTTTAVPAPTTTTTTTTTTTLVPETTTTTTTTTEPPPETTTTTTTTTILETTTTTTTTTTVSGLVYSTASASDACTAGLPLTGVIFFDGIGLCDSVDMEANEFIALAGGITVWVSNGVDVRQATINDPNVSGRATFVGACGACTVETTTTTTTTTSVVPPPETTTTTTTTTIPETTTTTTTTTIPETTTTTTTTTVAILCDEYFNNTGSPITGVNYVDCGGTVFNNQTVDPNQSICVQQGTLNGGDSGFLINLGNCSVTPPESTTTTTTTTLEPPPPTTTTTTTTTTLLSSQLRVENSSLDVVVSDVKVNGVTAPCVTGSYPIPAGENRDLSTTQIGVHSIEVTFTNTITGQNITITDSSLAVQCQTVNISDTFTFPSCNVDGNTQVLIAVQDGACVTP